MKTFFETKNIPDFLSEKEKVRFEENKYAKFFIPVSQSIQDVWVTYSGICLKTFKVYKGSVYWQAYPVLKFWAQGMFNVFTKKKKTVPGKSFFIHTPWSVVNYHHWLVDSLPRIFALQKEGYGDINLILPVALRDIAFVNESLSVFGTFSLTYMETDEILYLSETVLVDISPGKYFITSDLKQTIIKLKSSLSHPSKAIRKIYLTRRNVGYRTLQNESEVVDLLLKNNFEVIEADKFTLKEQVQLFSETKILVAIHGAALTNCVFMPAGSSVIELHPDIEMPDSIFNVCYHNLSHCFGLNYYFLGCQPVDANERFHTANLVADIQKLELILALAELN